LHAQYIQLGLTASFVLFVTIAQINKNLEVDAIETNNYSRFPGKRIGLQNHPM
jgi:hypothetical protein